MINEILHDPIFLAGKSEIATKDDLQVAQDLLDTLMAHKDSCVGMAANMIGVNKRIIKKGGVYNTEESCLSLLGSPRPCKRYRSIKVKYQTLDMRTRIKTYTGWTAQIIQHEVDHCDGVLI